MSKNFFSGRPFSPENVALAGFAGKLMFSTLAYSQEAQERTAPPSFIQNKLDLFQAKKVAAGSMVLIFGGQVFFISSRMATWTTK